MPKQRSRCRQLFDRSKKRNALPRVSDGAGSTECRTRADVAAGRDRRHKSIVCPTSDRFAKLMQRRKGILQGQMSGRIIDDATFRRLIRARDFLAAGHGSPTRLDEAAVDGLRRGVRVGSATEVLRH